MQRQRDPLAPPLYANTRHRRAVIYRTATTQLGLLQRVGQEIRAGFNKDDGMEESISRAGPLAIINSVPQ